MKAYFKLAWSTFLIMAGFIGSPGWAGPDALESRIAEDPLTHKRVYFSDVEMTWFEAEGLCDDLGFSMMPANKLGLFLKRGKHLVLPADFKHLRNYWSGTKTSEKTFDSSPLGNLGENGAYAVYWSTDAANEKDNGYFNAFPIRAFNQTGGSGLVGSFYPAKAGAACLVPAQPAAQENQALRSEKVGGRTWYLGDEKKSCTEVCGNAKVDPISNSRHLGVCKEVADAFRIPLSPKFDETACRIPIGCFVFNEEVYHCGIEGRSDASYVADARFCACIE